MPFAAELYYNQPIMKLREEWKWVVPIVVVCVLVFANSLSGEFVYDDTRQILRNPLIQENMLAAKALTSDVWAFKGDGTVVASNYWRPTFTAWHIVNYRLFGANPFGWHLLNLLLHCGVCILAFALLRRWAFSSMVATAIALVFAVHPVHVESIAWVSGAPDPLFALSFLGSLWFFISYAENRATNSLILAVILYALALGSKEIGILCLPIYYFILQYQDERSATDAETDKKKKKKKTFDNKTPLLVIGSVAAIYFVARFAVIGALSRPPDDAVGMLEALLSVPAIFTFYLRQAFFPYWLAVNYPLSPVSQIDLLNFVVPLVISIAVLAGVFFLARAGARARIAAGLMLLPLIPAMNSTAFISDQIVHDRYLYLPILGILMLIAIAVADRLNERYLLIAGVIIAAALGTQTFLYNRVWANELSLWSAAHTIDKSAFTSNQYASALSESERYDEAIAMYSSAIETKPLPRSYIGRSRALLKKQRYAEAERDIRTVLSYPPEKIELYALYQAYEAFSIAFTEQRNYPAAIKILTEAREKMPMYSASLTVKMAIVQYQAGQKEQAFRELEMAKAQARRELLPEAKSVFLRLGMLYAELDRKEEARREWVEFLNLTATSTDQVILAERKQAAQYLERLK